MSTHQTKTFTNEVADVLPNQMEAQRLAEMIVLRMKPSEVYELYEKHLDQNDFLQQMWDTGETPASNINKMVILCYTLMILYVNCYEIGWQDDIENVMDDPEQRWNMLFNLYDERGIEWDLWG